MRSRKKIILTSVLVFLGCFIFAFQWVNAYLNKSINLFKDKKYEEATARFEKLKKFDRFFDGVPVYYLLSIYVNTGKFSEAGPLALEMVKKNSRDLFAVKALVISLIENDKLQDGLEVARKSVEQDGIDVLQADDLLKICITAIKDKHNLEKSIEWFLKNKKFWRFPNSIKAVLINVEIMRSSSRFQTEVVELRKVLRKLDPSDASNLINLARIMKDTSDFNDAQTYYAEALKLQPEQATYAEEYADYLVKHSREKDLPRRLYQQALRHVPESLQEIRTRLNDKLKSLH